ncbi:TPA: hypothetical protein ACGW3N_000463 [Pseudomonas aeruginosa]|uniref:Uncharacterized protein n=1 Tax=Pseudomonas aeruginosa TaxID=287 RepID=A0A241XSB2_PSEAI|nr:MULTISPECIES: hypothetical protein [Pseudomonas]MBH4100060.1 hypothetical protein [Pseudomonas aeruginosa]MBI6604943.1 hypothetical protein [Pseudomonas sp. S4_EA_1b]OBY60366.1 hypothetical protein A9513_000645 [Pseudomonas sp. AU12215]OTI63379.1 hypothetical protein CAZ10_11180 [Pseudomonas aeruginosa]
MTDDYHQILSIAQNTRKIFEEMLDHSIGSATTKGTCLYAAFLCAEVIRKFSGFPTRIRGGDGEFKKGINIQGSCHGHYWTEVSVNGCRYIVDITADQFGLPPVLVVDAIEDSLRYRPGLQAAVDAHVNDLRRELEKQRHVDASTSQPAVAPGTSQSSGSMSNISEGRI